MTIRSDVNDLIQLGPFPSSDDADAQDIDRRGEILNRIRAPVSDEEATALLSCFGPDDAYGLAWALLHLIETAPGGSPVKEKPAPFANEWIRRLWERAHR